MNLKDLPLFAQTQPTEVKPAAKHWSVSELTQKLRGVLEPAFSQVWVVGEISNFRPSSAGHLYFSLKDAQAAINAAVFGWANRPKSKTFDLKDGMQVLCRGKITVFPPRGTYQITVDQIEPLGAGALQVAFEQLKAKLQSEGLFESDRKRALPKFPRQIAVVTSPSGAAIQDMLTVLKRRAPHIRVIVVPAIVQGEDTSRQVIRGLKAANFHRLGDVIVLARGGGSMEDLWGFNDEALAREIAASDVPVINAVGHEIDFTIADFVADLRAPTPSAAAEIVSHAWVEASQWLTDARLRLRQAVLREISSQKMVLAQMSARVVSPRDRLREQSQRVDDQALRLERAMATCLERRRGFFERAVGKLDALSPLKVLDRGYSILSEQKTQKVIKSAQDVIAGQEYEVRFSDGSARVKAIK